MGGISICFQLVIKNVFMSHLLSGFGIHRWQATSGRHKYIWHYHFTLALPIWQV